MCAHGKPFTSPSQILQYETETVQTLLEMVADQDVQSQEHSSDTINHRFLFNVYQTEVRCPIVMHTHTHTHTRTHSHAHTYATNTHTHSHVCSLSTSFCSC